MTCLQHAAATHLIVTVLAFESELTDQEVVSQAR